MKTPFILLVCLLVIVGAKKKWRCIKNVRDIALKDRDFFMEQCVYGTTPVSEPTDDCTNYFMKNQDLDPVCKEDTLKKLCKRNDIEMKNKYDFTFACKFLWGEQNQMTGVWMNEMKKQCNEERILEIMSGDCGQQCDGADAKTCSSCVMKHQDIKSDCKELTLRKQCKQYTMKFNFAYICGTIFGPSIRKTKK